MNPACGGEAEGEGSNPTHSWNSEPQNIEQEISNDEVWNRCAQSFFKNNNDKIPYFDIRYFLFDIVIRFFRVSYLIRLDAGDQRRGFHLKPLQLILV